jgi:hypothetical protein
MSAWISTMLRRVSGTGIGTDIGLVMYRDLAIAISRRYLRPKKTFHRDRSENDEDDDRDEKMETMTSLFGLSAGSREQGEDDDGKWKSETDTDTV